MTNLSDLPFDILVNILVQVDDADPLGWLIYPQHAKPSPDEVLWRAIHCAKYDNPLDACAFLERRKDIRWRQRVLDRAFTQRFVDEHSVRLDKVWPDYPEPFANAGLNRRTLSTEVWEENSRMFAHTPRVLFTVLDIFLDLPSIEIPSENSKLLQDITKTLAFRYVLREGPSYIDPGRENVCAQQGVRSYWEAANHLETVLANLPGFAAYIEQDYQYLPPMRDDTSLSPPEPPSLHWSALPVIPWSQMHRNVSIVLESASVGWMVNSCLVRSPGVLELERPSAMGQVWDWAGVAGPWRAYSTNDSPNWFNDPSATDAAKDWPVRLDGTFRLIATATRDGVQDAFNLHEGAQETVDLWGHLSPDTVPTTVLPPIYFYSEDHTPLEHSKPTYLREPHPKMFLYGVVHLTTNSPPKIMWTVVGQVIGESERSIIMRGIQPGGRKADLGFFGSWGSKSEFQKASPRDDDPDELTFSPLGSAWFFRKDARQPYEIYD